MRKKIRLQINALAKKIILEGNQFETSSLKALILKLYENLTILEYLETPIDSILDATDPEALDSKSYREENWFEDPEPVPQPQYEDEIAEPLMEKIKDIVAQMPHEAERVDELLEKILPKKETDKSDLEEFAATYQEMPVFEKKVSGDLEKEKQFSKNKQASTEKQKSLNDKLNQSLNIGLNDRLAFIKHLFENNADDYKRVLSQINTMSTYNEAINFIDMNVKPDYNNWVDKDKYADRFMLIIEKRFN